MRHVLLFSTGFALVFAALAPSQERAQRPTLRRNALGEVRTSDGKPWIGARVFLATRSLALGHRIEIDLVETTTDQRGRFRAPVLLGQGYRVWARSQVADGRYRVTQAWHGVIAGSPVVLTEREGDARVVVLAITGREPWQERGGLRYHVTDGYAAADVRPDERGLAVLPPAATAWRSLEVELVRNGERRRLSSLRIYGKQGSADRPTPVAIPAPVSVQVAVWSSSTGQARPGAVILGRFASRAPWTKVGRTDERGLARIEVAGHSSRTRSFVALAEGYCPGEFERGRSPKYDTDNAAYEGTKYHSHLIPGANARLRLFATPGKPAANHPVLVAAPATINRARSFAATDFDFLMRTNDRGELTLPGDNSDSQEVELIVPPTTLASLPGRLGVSPRVQLLVPHPPRAGVVGAGAPAIGAGVAKNAGQDKGKSGAYHDVVLSALCPVEIRVSTHAGVPAYPAELRIHRVPSPAPSNFRSMLTDQRGNLRLLLEDKNRWFIAAVDASGMAFHVVETRRDPAGQDRSLARLDVRLHEVVVIEGRIVDRAGKRVSGAVVEARPNFDSFAPGLDGTETLRLPASGNALRHLVSVEAETWRVVAWMLRGLGLVGRTGDDGTFRVGLPPVKGPYVISTTVRRDGRTLRARTSLEYDGTPIKDLVIEVRK